ncbi:MAG: tRNA1(Val) (adenine(37)-N6)-methyltransferase [Clostridia bacterium]|nr:tRNA1(Val) (adenine(37)-N6)-methyltransferase [Clostridia bacterium]
MFDEQIDPAGPGLGMIREGERVDDLQLCGLRIIQKESGFRFGMDAVLLSDFARVEARDRVADFGTGTGILPLLLAGRGRGAHFDAIELQEDMADMAKRSVHLNGLTERIYVHHCRVEEADTVIAPGSLDAIVCNPPYGVPGTTLLNPEKTLSTARHQSESGLTEWYRMAYRLLRGKGRFHMVYPAPRMLEAMTALSKARLEPKRFRLIYPYGDKPANLVLIEAMKDAKPMLHPEPPLVVYEQNGSMTAELKRIYHLTD